MLRTANQICRRLNVSILTIGFLLMLSNVLVACPTCKDALASGNSANLVNGFGYSILFMMATPFLILGGISAYFYYEIRKARANSATAVQPNAGHSAQVSAS